jgi:uncharacterized membrane-anchored protein YhcB (DUF1043 family)
MLTLGVETIVVLLLITGAVCALAGYTFAQARQRQAGGGKSAEELKSELAEYRDDVSEHFQTTATLLHEMTEQYRSVYEHMAAGAQTLCDPERSTSQLEHLAAGLLPAAAADETVSGATDGNSKDQVMQEAAGPASDASAAFTHDSETSGAESGSVPEREFAGLSSDGDGPYAGADRTPEPPRVGADPVDRKDWERV